MTAEEQQRDQEPAAHTNELAWLRRISASPLYVGIASTVAGVVVGLAITWVVHKISEPPSDSIVLQIMDKEVRFAENHRGDLALQLYAPNAVIVDAGCQNPGTGSVWQGARLIQQRYETLPSFVSLGHDNAQIRWYPSNNSAKTATAMAETVGVISPATPIRGHEQWEFALINGRWLITSFTYNLCFP